MEVLPCRQPDARVRILMVLVENLEFLTDV